jgi:hypothetical protein
MKGISTLCDSGSLPCYPSRKRRRAAGGAGIKKKNKKGRREKEVIER